MNASFIYDGLGRREAKTINGSLTEFLYDGLNPVQETSGMAVLANILPGTEIDEFFMRSDVITGTASYYLTDVLGSPLAVADTLAVVQTEYSYHAFGQSAATGVANSSSYQYTGRENDSTGLYYYRARYYHPLLQRFISEDPIRFSGGDVNLYVYVANTPTLGTDPSGLKGPPMPVVPIPTPQGEVMKGLADVLDEMKRIGDGFGDYNDWRRLIDEISRKLKDLEGQFECDAWVIICFRPPTPTKKAAGSVKIYGPFSKPVGLRIAGYRCIPLMVSGTRRDCCNAQ